MKDAENPEEKPARREAAGPALTASTIVIVNGVQQPRTVRERVDPTTIDWGDDIEMDFGDPAPDQ